MIIDVDCTDDKAKSLCETYGVSGYPTLKYFGPGLPDDGQAYEDGRDYNTMSKFVKRKSKKPCVPDTEENCDKKDKAYLEEIKAFDAAKLQEERDKMEKEIGDLSAEQKEASDLFETQKEEAMATMKKAEDLKKKLSKLQSKVGYKLLILKAKTKTKDEL
mmetsp:Transcript_142171/g.370446  ORF Transcript_142171/g.370446 Transcript_142171/m.370446 type:complete len:160 (-) Transcript_142171:87-566(-)